MRNRARNLVRQAAVLSALMLAAAACTERPPQSSRAMTAPTTVLRSSTGAPLVLACPIMPGVSKRGVAAGSRGDVNGNGVVCDRRAGSPGHERMLTMDDGLMPASAAR